MWTKASLSALNKMAKNKYNSTIIKGQHYKPSPFESKYHHHHQVWSSENNRLVALTWFFKRQARLESQNIAFPCAPTSTMANTTSRETLRLTKGRIEWSNTGWTLLAVPWQLWEWQRMGTICTIYPALKKLRERPQNFSGNAKMYYTV